MKIISSSKLDPETLTRLKAHVYDIVGCCQEVHRELGPWLNEYMYQEALKVSFEEKQVSFEKEHYFQISSVKAMSCWNAKPSLHWGTNNANNYGTTCA